MDSPMASVPNIFTLGSSGLFFSATTSSTPRSPGAEEGTKAARMTLSSGVFPMRMTDWPKSKSITCRGRGKANL